MRINLRKIRLCIFELNFKKKKRIGAFGDVSPKKKTKGILEFSEVRLTQ